MDHCAKSERTSPFLVGFCVARGRAVRCYPYNRQLRLKRRVEGVAAALGSPRTIGITVRKPSGLV